MAQPGDGSKALEKAVDDGPVVSTQQQTPSRASSTTIGLHAGKEKEAKSTPVANSSDSDALFAHLPEHERRILKDQLDGPEVKASFVTLFRYASKWDILIMIVSAICAIAAGAALPLFTVSNQYPSTGWELSMLINTRF